MSKLRLIYESLSPKHTRIVAMKAQHSHCCAVWLEEGMFRVQVLFFSIRETNRSNCLHVLISLDTYCIHLYKTQKHMHTQWLSQYREGSVLLKEATWKRCQFVLFIFYSLFSQEGAIKVQNNIPSSRKLWLRRQKWFHIRSHKIHRRYLIENSISLKTWIFFIVSHAQHGE